MTAPDREEGRLSTPDLRTIAGLLFAWTIALATGLDYFDNVIFSFYAIDIAGGVHAPPDEIIWASSAYAVAGVLGILQHQWWVERLGHARYIGAGLLLFGLAALLAASSQNSLELAMARALQGYTMGPMLGAARVLIQLSFAPRERPGATRVFLLMILLASALAPLVGGHLVAAFGWRALLACSAPPAFVIGLLAFWTVPPTGQLPPEERGEPHLWPYIAFGLAFAILQVVIQRLRLASFDGSPLLVGAVACGLGLLAWFLWHQWRHPRPLISLQGLRQSTFRTGLLIYAFYYFISNALGYLVSRLLQRGLNYPVEVAGNLVGLTALTSLAGALLYFRYAGAVRHKKLIIVPGFLVAAFLCAWIVGLSPHIDMSWLVLPLILRGLLLLFIALPTANVTFGIFTADDFNHGYRIKNVVKQITYSASTAFVIVLEQHRLALHQSRLAEASDPSRAPFLQWMAMASSHLAAAGLDSRSAERMAMVQFRELIDRQAVFMSVQDGFYVIMLLSLAAAGLALLQRRID